MSPFSDEFLTEAKRQAKFACKVFVDLKPTEKGELYSRSLSLDADQLRRLYAFVSELSGQPVPQQQKGLLGEILKGGV